MKFTDAEFLTFTVFVLAMLFVAIVLVYTTFSPVDEKWIVTPPSPNGACYEVYVRGDFHDLMYETECE